MSVKAWLNLSARKASLDMQVYHKGRNSVSLECTETQHLDGNDFCTLMQQFSATNYLGKRMRFAGFVRTEEVSGWCGLWMRIDDKLQNMLSFDNMQYRSIKGTTDWNYYACVLDIPAEANCLNIGIILSGAGKAWLDDCTFEEVGMDIPVTDTDLPMEPQNLKFEERSY